MIKVRNLSKHFGKLRAVDNLSFDVGQGEIVGLLGPNGAGKTTAMRILTGFLAQTKGKVTVNGWDNLRDSRRVRSILGYLPEDNPLYKDMTVKGLLRHIARLKGVPWRHQRRAIDEVLHRCKIGDVRKRLIGKLSKGYRQRVGLAQAILGSPKVLVLDEPTVGLDPKQINEIRELIHGLKGKQTVFLSSHILPEVSAVSDRVLIINQGKLVATGTPDELGEKLKTAQIIHITMHATGRSVKPLLDGIEGILNVDAFEVPGEETVHYKIVCDKGHDLRSEIAKVLVQEDFDLLEMKSESLSLEDIFLKLVTKEEEVTV